MAVLSEDLKHLLNKSNVPEELQVHLQSLGLTTVNLLALLGDNRQAVRDCLAAEPFNLDPAAGGISPTVKLQRRIAQAQVVDAW